MSDGFQARSCLLQRRGCKKCVRQQPIGKQLSAGLRGAWSCCDFGSDFAAQHTTSPHVTFFSRRPFFVVVQSESELRSSVDAAVALVGVITLWTSPPCSLALWFSVTGALR